MTAFGAADGAAEDEVFVEVGACWRVGVLAQTLLDLEEGFVGDEAFVLAFADGDAPVGALHFTGVKHAGQDAVRGFVGDLAVAVLRESVLVLKKLAHLALGLKAA
ncbi:MAG: hypothetical protein AAF830_13995 [Pseudomonadota bacterium]